MAHVFNTGEQNKIRSELFLAVREGQALQLKEHETLLQRKLKDKKDYEEFLHRLRDGGESLLHTACRLGRVKIVRRLLSCNFDLQVRDSAGDTPLLLAASNKQWDVVNLLLKHGANLNDMNLGYTVPHFIIEHGQRALLVSLLDAGALSSDFTTPRGNTCLHLAAHYSRKHIVSELLARPGSSVFAKNLAGKRPVDLSRDHEIIQILKDAEKEPSQKKVLMALQKEERKVLEEKKRKEEEARQAELKHKQALYDLAEKAREKAIKDLEAKEKEAKDREERYKRDQEECRLLELKRHEEREQQLREIERQRKQTLEDEKRRFIEAREKAEQAAREAKLAAEQEALEKQRKKREEALKWMIHTQPMKKEPTKQNESLQAESEQKAKQDVQSGFELNSEEFVECCMLLDNEYLRPYIPSTFAWASSCFEFGVIPLQNIPYGYRDKRIENDRLNNFLENHFYLIRYERNNIIQVLSLLARIDAEYNFIHLMKSLGKDLSAQGIKILDFLRSQDPKFFERCGKLLLISSVIHQWPELLSYLLKERHVPVDTRTAVHQDSLFHLLMLSNPENKGLIKTIINILIEQGLDIHTKNGQGKTTLMYGRCPDLLSYEGVNPLVSIPVPTFTDTLRREFTTPVNLFSVILNDGYSSPSEKYEMLQEFCAFGLGFIKSNKRCEALAVKWERLQDGRITTEQSKTKIDYRRPYETLDTMTLFYLKPKGLSFESTPVSFEDKIAQAEILMPLEVDPNFSPNFACYTTQDGGYLRPQFGIKGRTLPGKPKATVWIFEAAELQAVLEGKRPGLRVPNLQAICANLRQARKADPGLVDEVIAKILFEAEVFSNASKPPVSLSASRDAGDRKGIAEKERAEVKHLADRPSESRTLSKLPENLEIIHGDLEAFLKADILSSVVFKYTPPLDLKEKSEARAVHLQFLYTPTLCLQIFTGEGSVVRSATVNVEALNAIYYRHPWMDVACYMNPDFKEFQYVYKDPKEKSIYYGQFFGIKLETLTDFWLEQFWPDFIRLGFASPKIVDYFKRIIKITHGSKTPSAAEDAKEQEILALAAKADPNLEEILAKLTQLILDSAENAALLDRKVKTYPKQSHTRRPTRIYGMSPIMSARHLLDVDTIGLDYSSSGVEFIENACLISLMDVLKSKPKFMIELFNRLLKNPKIYRLSEHSVVFNIVRDKLREFPIDAESSALAPRILTFAAPEATQPVSSAEAQAAAPASAVLTRKKSID